MGRRDGKLVRKLDSLHIITPLLFHNRCDNEAYISETIDLTKINEYLERKNEVFKAEAKASASPGEIPDYFKMTLFHVIVTAMMKTIRLRPQLNRFIANKRIYQRNEITSSFVVKKKFSDTGDEALAIVRGGDDENIDTIREQIKKQVYSLKNGEKDSSTASMDMVSSLPFFLVRFVAWLVCKLNVHGKVPKAFVATDPYYTSVVLSNLGSIKLKSGYHHLANWGTNSIFVVVGEKKMRPFFEEDGTYTMKDSVELGITIDERLADGYYYSKSIRLMKELLQNPELLETALSEEVEY
ncbi:MAG: 2-oxo acid dehydrogenase subunit E2 [Lentihominibacter sp.]|jgi:pyruvate/2-oxoglutarate dehydrogenase complex dihydrolipoamide acyltransferase (E2) component